MFPVAYYLQQLEDKKIGFFYGHISTDVLHNLLNKYNIDYEEVDVGFTFPSQPQKITATNNT